MGDSLLVMVILELMWMDRSTGLIIWRQILGRLCGLMTWPCSLELISLAYQPWYIVFLSQQISEQYFQPGFSAKVRVPEDPKLEVLLAIT
jgi:hypothetical protein